MAYSARFGEMLARRLQMPAIKFKVTQHMQCVSDLLHVARRTTDRQALAEMSLGRQHTKAR